MKISIVTPSYQQGKFIRKTIESVLSQDYYDKEYVVFDGGSADETVSILKSFGRKVRWVSEKDQGQSHAINKGIQATQGEIIGWLNSDDVYYPDALKNVARAFHENPGVDVIYGEADHIDEHDNVLEPYPVETWDFARMMETCIICQPACFFRRNVVEKYGLLDERRNWCMDYEYWLRLAKKGVNFQKISKRIAGSRMYLENKTLRARVKVHEEINNVMKEHFGKVPNRWIFNYAHYIADETVNRQKNESEFRKIVGIEALRGFFRWRTMPKISSLKNILRDYLR
jgi:glycosyltransferase involved in cell wall biosynthesis